MSGRCALAVPMPIRLECCETRQKDSFVSRAVDTIDTRDGWAGVGAGGECGRRDSAGWLEHVRRLLRPLHEFGLTTISLLLAGKLGRVAGYLDDEDGREVWGSRRSAESPSHREATRQS